MISDIPYAGDPEALWQAMAPGLARWQHLAPSATVDLELREPALSFEIDREPRTSEIRDRTSDAPRAKEEVLAAIRAHPSLKGYIEPGAPPGYLLIKPQSDPDNFVLRCQTLGFNVKRLLASGREPLE